MNKESEKLSNEQFHVSLNCHGIKIIANLDIWRTPKGLMDALNIKKSIEIAISSSWFNLAIPLLSFSQVNIKPFESNDDALILGDLIIENHDDHLSIYGEMKTKSLRLGLNNMLILYEIMKAIELKLSNNTCDIYDTQINQRTDKIDNPF